MAVKEFGSCKDILLEKAGPWIEANPALESNNWGQWMPYQVAKIKNHTLGNMLLQQVDTGGFKQSWGLLKSQYLTFFGL